MQNPNELREEPLFLLYACGDSDCDMSHRFTITATGKAPRTPNEVRHHQQVIEAILVRLRGKW